jgi:hypothetical protein
MRSDRNLIVKPSRRPFEISEHSLLRIHPAGFQNFSASPQLPSERSLELESEIVEGCHFACLISGGGISDDPNSWICIDFKNYRIKPTHFSIRSRTDYDYHHLRSWNLEGLTDDGKWVRLDCRTGNTELAGAGAVRTFSIGNVCEVRSLRLQQTALNSSGNNYLILKSIEFFGELRELSPSVQ